MARAIGLMSGTSLDGVDVALIETDGIAVTRLGRSAMEPYPRAVRDALAALVHDPARAEHDALADLEAELTELNARAVEQLRALEPGPIDVVGYHGQTILHRPERRYTRQLGNGAALSRRLGLPVVASFRHADVAAGGQGAPFAPLYHAALARDVPQPVCVLNLGGVGNVTYIHGDTIVAFDTGPANAMIDDWVGRHAGLLCDEGGRIAAKGTVAPAVLARLMDNAYFATPAPKSLDRNDFSAKPVDGLSLEDGAATLTEFTARSIGAALPHLPGVPRRWLATGGGRHNPTLMARIAAAVQAPVEPVEAVGWQGDVLEAQAFGFLAIRSLKGLPLSLPTTTGVPEPMTGGILHRAA